MSHGRVIGRDGGMPWHLPADLKHFKTVTWGKPIVMGRRTFESIGRALPGRRNLVISRHPPQTVSAGVEWFDSWPAALAACAGEAEVMVVGGGQLYAQTLAQACRLWITEIDADLTGDTYFPAWQGPEWRQLEHWQHPADERHPYALNFSLWERSSQTHEHTPAGNCGPGMD